MEITRTFHPVGQGGFYTEAFDSEGKPMVVYDCGGNTAIGMKQYIDSILPKNQKIEAVFISHLHNDHINGLQHLLDKACVKRLFLPLITSPRQFETLFYSSLHFSDSYNAGLIVSLLGEAREYGRYGDTAITEVSENHGERENNDREQVPIDSGISRRIASGTRLTVGTEWVYIPYNPPFNMPAFENITNDSDRQEIERIYNITSASQQAKEIAVFVEKKTVNESKKIYKKLFGDIHNSQSMTVFSGVLGHNTVSSDVSIGMEGQDPETNNRSCNCPFITPLNTKGTTVGNFLYTGDYEAKDKIRMEGLSDFYTRHNVWDLIYGIQIPHHGSRNNYNQDLYQKRSFAIASCGSTNRHHHPNIDTLVNIFFQGCMSWVVTDNAQTMIVQRIRF